MWRNWQTHQTQNLAGNHVGSSPTIGTKNSSICKLSKYYFLYQISSGTRKGGLENSPVDYFPDAGYTVPPSVPKIVVFAN